MSKLRLLIVEDEAAQRRLVADILRREGFEVADLPNAEVALERLRTSPPDLVICDWRMPGMTGGEFLKLAKSEQIPSAFIIMTAYGSISHAVEAVRLGADDYLAKPFEREALLLAVRRVLKNRQLEQENHRLRQEVGQTDGLGELIGGSPAMTRLFKTLTRIALTDVTVLITGESGTGKEVIARTLHHQSSRASGPFVAVNCAAIPETLIESELFGHEKGAFTGAHKRRAGRFEEANGGTLFLDEVPSMPLALQATLLRVLQERKVTLLGGRGETPVDVRLVAATNRDLARMVRDGQFREDLYYRLNVVPVTVPPLRERREDIPLLAQAFLEKAAQRYQVKTPILGRDSLPLLLGWSWPGNVRELANLMERLTLMAESEVISTSDLPPEFSFTNAEPGCPFRLPAEGLQWESMEAGLLRQAMDRTGGNRAEAARLLGLSYKTFLYRLEKFELGTAEEP